LQTKKKKKILKIEKQNDDEMFVFVSQLHLDVQNAWNRLKVMFDGYSAQPPRLFILCGNFTQHRLSSTVEDLNKLKRYFNKLATFISCYPVLLKHSKFVFVPGPQDPGVDFVLPRPRLSKIVTRTMEQKLVHEGVCKAVFMSNPCRIRYCTQEIVIFRSDLLKKLRRNCVVPPNVKQWPDLEKHLVTTVLAQSHLSPIPLICQPRYWKYDHSLRLYPLPDVIILADSLNQFNEKEKNCTISNPGEFSKNGQFSVYFPSQKVVELSGINQD